MLNSLDARMYGVDLFGEPISQRKTGPIAERFGFAPFSVLDARSGEWQDRKRAWLGVGLESEVGRGETLTYRGAASEEDAMGQAMNARGGGTSIFDPVLCECVYRWFSAPGAQVVDPFAGGSVRGVIAGMLGRNYWGCDLRQEQVDANRVQADEIMPDIRPEWVCGDAVEALGSAPMADLVFSCPPYGDLERYSDDPRDLSTQEWSVFASTYAVIILGAAKRLKPDRFACFVVGDFRDRRGYYRDFVSVTTAAFRAAGCLLYNEAILVTPVGSACMRVTKQFQSGRKFAKTHQNVLVFCKGDWKKAAKAAEGVGHGT